MTPTQPGLVREAAATDGRIPGPSGEQATLKDQIRELSRGRVAEVPPDGPVFAEPRRALETRPTSFVRQFGTADRVKVAALTLGWVGCLVWFWVWWLSPEHRIGWVGLAVNSALLLYLALLPVHFLVAVVRLRRFDSQIEVPLVRAAFVVTRAPSEHWDIARTTLEAMLQQDYPHPYDVWLCDEDPSSDVLDWCEANGVRVSAAGTDRTTTGRHGPAAPAARRATSPSSTTTGATGTTTSSPSWTATTCRAPRT